MKFPEPSETTSGECQPMPDGDHVCDITAVRERSISGREVMIVTFTPQDGSLLPVDKFLDPTVERDLVAASQLRAAVGLKPGVDLVDFVLRGRSVTLSTKIAREPSGEVKTTKRGDPIVYVNSIAPPPGGPPAAQPAARRPNTGAAKVAAARGDQAGGDDDVPF